VPIDERYVRWRIKNIFKKYDEDGKETVTNKYSNLVRCTKGHFRNDFENKVFKHFENEGDYTYCIDNKDVVLQGTRDF
jgi:hypothetical protein